MTTNDDSLIRWYEARQAYFQSITLKTYERSLLTSLMQNKTRKISKFGRNFKNNFLQVQKYPNFGQKTSLLE